MPEGFPKEHNERIALLKKAATGNLTDEEKAFVERAKAQDDGIIISHTPNAPKKESVVTKKMLGGAGGAEHRHRKTLGGDYE